MMRFRLSVAGFLLCLMPIAAAAQSGTRLSIQASALYQGLSGSAYEGVGGGLGLEGQLRFNLDNGRSVGAGLQYSRHSFAEGLGIDDLSLLGLFVEPRILLNQSATRSAPYASLRLGLLRQSANVGGADVSATGFQINGGGGLLFVANDRTNVDVGATIGAVRFGNYSTGSAAGSGFNIVLRLGVSVAVGQ